MCWLGGRFQAGFDQMTLAIHGDRHGPLAGTDHHLRQTVSGLRARDHIAAGYDHAQGRSQNS